MVYIQRIPGGPNPCIALHWIFIMTLFSTLVKHRSGDFKVYIKMKSIKRFFQKIHGTVKFTEHYFPLSKK